MNYPFKKLQLWNHTQTSHHVLYLFVEERIVFSSVNVWEKFKWVILRTNAKNWWCRCSLVANDYFSFHWITNILSHIQPHILHIIVLSCSLVQFSALSLTKMIVNNLLIKSVIFILHGLPYLWIYITKTYFTTTMLVGAEITCPQSWVSYPDALLPHPSPTSSHLVFFSHAHLFPISYFSCPPWPRWTLALQPVCSHTQF